MAKAPKFKNKLVDGFLAGPDPESEPAEAGPEGGAEAPAAKAPKVSRTNSTERVEKNNHKKFDKFKRGN